MLRVPSLLAAFAAANTCACDIEAQSATARASASRAAAVQARTAQGLNTVMSLDLEAAPLAQALRTIARQAELHIIFGDRVHQDDRRITLKRERITAAQA